jgi:hypothetical protein
MSSKPAMPVRLFWMDASRSYFGAALSLVTCAVDVDMGEAAFHVL